MVSIVRTLSRWPLASSLFVCKLLGLSHAESLVLGASEWHFFTFKKVLKASG